MNIMNNNNLIIKKKVGYFGIEIYNFNINSDENKHILQQLLDEYLVIVIKNTALSYEEQIKLATIFGEPTLAHPVVPGNDYFPQILEIDGAKGFLNKLEAVHKITPLAYWGEPFDYLASIEETIKLYEESKKIIPVIHPVVRINKRTQKPSFFVNPGFTSHILNLTKIESDNILKLIYEHITQPEFVLRHKWEKNDVVIWDNTCTAHYAINDYGSFTRKMRRVTIKGYNNIKSKKTEDPLKIIR